MENNHVMETHERAIRGRRFSDQLIAGALRVFSRIHITLYRWTDGIIGGRIFGNRMLLLTTTGRKTGQLRTTPVAYLTIGDAMVIVGGAAGAAKQPAWWLNLESHPEAQVRVGRRKLQVCATRALPEEQQRLWACYPAQHALFDKMQKRVSREIPVVILRPLSEPSPAQEKLVRRTAAHKPPVVRANNHPAHALLRAGTRRLNPLMLSLAGSSRLPMLAVIYHRGRRSGRSYATPLGARPIAHGFVIPLTFGEQANWFRNVQAAGGCVIRWKGANYPLIDPEVVDWATARSAFYLVERVLMPIIGIEQFVRLKHAPATSAVSQNELLDPLHSW
jgi:deazaflavin-dependent oxidoreductase (nitroreductase family)